MKPWIKRTLVGLVGASLLAGGIAAFATRHHGGYGLHGGPPSAEQVAMWRGRLIDRAGSELTLDDAQKARLGVLFDTLAAQRQAVMGDQPDTRTAVQALIAGPTFDRAQAQALVTGKADALRIAAPEVIAAVGDFFDGLNPDQQARVRSLLARHHRHGEGHAHHDGERR